MIDTQTIPPVWQDIKTSPRDGTPILALKDMNNGHYEHIVVWWHDDPLYPWACDTNAYGDRIAYWMPLPEPVP